MKKLLLITALLCVLCSCEEKALTGTHEGHEWVDLGLPSGLKWATCNVGASLPEDYGNYYAWGETNTKTEYTKDNSVSRRKSWGDIATSSDRDAARANWGGSWRMPTEAEFQELRETCTWTWITRNGNQGYKVTGPNGKSIFLPAAGFRNDVKLRRADEYGCYWSSSPHTSKVSARYLYFHKRAKRVNSYHRYHGFSVRPVLD